MPRIAPAFRRCRVGGRDRVGPGAELLTCAWRYAQHLADDRDRQRRAQPSHEVGRRSFACDPVEQIVGDPDDLVRAVIVTGAGLTFLTQTWEPLVVLLVTASMGVPDATYGVILALGAGGGIIGAVGTPALARRIDHGRLRVAALGVTAAADLALAAVPSPPMAALALALASAAFALWNVLSMSLRQRLVPTGTLGRVNAANRTLSMTAALLGTLAGGWIAHVLGLRAPLWFSGIALAALALLTARLRRPRAD